MGFLDSKWFPLALLGVLAGAGAFRAAQIVAPHLSSGVTAKNCVITIVDRAQLRSWAAGIVVTHPAFTFEQIGEAVLLATGGCDITQLPPSSLAPYYEIVVVLLDEAATRGRITPDAAAAARKTIRALLVARGASEAELVAISP